MKRINLRTIPFAVLIFGFAPTLAAATVTIDFDSLTDSTFVTTQYSGVTFSNALALTSGISLNELDFPPRSGANVASDINGPISLLFSTPITDFLAYFTYVSPLTVRGFDSSNHLLASVSSLHSSNTATGGDPGSNPNESLELVLAAGFSRIVITGDPGGSSFTVDDVTLTTGAVVSTVPEPSGFVCCAITFLTLIELARRRRSVY